MKAQESMEGFPKTETPRVSPFHAILHSAFSNWSKLPFKVSSQFMVLWLLLQVSTLQL